MVYLSAISERPQSYSSPAIIARRRRILEETRKVIEEQGIAALSMSDIGQRAGVAKRTLYNAFQTRERMIALAIREYFEEYVAHSVYASEPGTLTHNLERMISVVRRNRKIRNYVRAILTLYFSSDLDKDVWEAMHSLARHHNLEWLNGLQKRKQLNSWVNVRDLVDDLIRFEYATMHEWAQGRISDDTIVLRMSCGYLGIVNGAVRGAARREVEALLKDIEERGEEALPFRRQWAMAA